jgi:SAM-dependent methyltransferase
MSLREIIELKGVPSTEFLNVEHKINFRPNWDIGREFYIKIFALLREYYKEKNVLEIGYCWGGRSIPNSKVLDLYDKREDVDYRVDVCNMIGINDESFDYIICNSVLEHIQKFWLAVEEIKRVLKKDGIIFCSVPSVWPYHPGNNDINFGGDYWRITHHGMKVLFDFTEEIACFYLPPAIIAGDDMRSGWGCVYIGIKNND